MSHTNAAIPKMTHLIIGLKLPYHSELCFIILNIHFHETFRR